MEDFDQYLNTSSNPEERDAARQLREGLSLLRLEEKVKKAAAQRVILQRRQRWRWLLSAAVLVILAGTAYFFLRGSANNIPARDSSKETQSPGAPQNRPNDTPRNPPVQPQETPQPVTPVKTPDNPETRPNRPMAQLLPSERLAAPRYAAPHALVRGENSDPSEIQTLLNKIWYTDYPLRALRVNKAYITADSLLKKRDFVNAFIQLHRFDTEHPNNDTIRYLKGYCLMELGQGEEAIPYFKSVQGRLPVWEAQLEWYEGLSWLQAGNTQKAKPIFQKIARTKQHSYRVPSQKALKLMK